MTRNKAQKTAADAKAKASAEAARRVRSSGFGRIAAIDWAIRKNQIDGRYCGRLNNPP